jgi:quercetin dioxygenase-like cupin family protein
MIDKQLYQMHQTPNAVMHTLAAPSTGTNDLAVWTVEMRAGQQGPLHTADQEQVWVILDGALAINGTEHTGTTTIAAGVERRIEALEDTQALVASRAPVTVATGEGVQPLPWAA